MKNSIQKLITVCLFVVCFISLSAFTTNRKSAFKPTANFSNKKFTVQEYFHFSYNGADYYVNGAGTATSGHIANLSYYTNGTQTGSGSASGTYSIDNTNLIATLNITVTPGGQAPFTYSGTADYSDSPF
ncbi:hypothetical protein [Mucilaginibacter agri]|uniref:MBG domain-containing protein n=1 Tax=Mucilaginibacter agri TaxID=2695265 RepID=A0A966DSX4_9SPHI|nr:hypothetical protein [Mucilaginibacter agri]NCD70643.1 hypothetical protein [Mucilaginibacter agri]